MRHLTHKTGGVSLTAAVSTCPRFLVTTWSRPTFHLVRLPISAPLSRKFSEHSLSLCITYLPETDIVGPGRSRWSSTRGGVGCLVRLGRPCRNWSPCSSSHVNIRLHHRQFGRKRRDRLPAPAGAASALVGATHYGIGLLSSALVGWFAEGTPWAGSSGLVGGADQALSRCLRTVSRTAKLGKS